MSNVGLSCEEMTLVTPFGFGCRVCDKPFGASLWSMQRHFNSHGITVSMGENLRLQSMRKNKEEQVRQNFSSVVQYLTDEKLAGYLCKCIVGSPKLSNMKPHLHSKRTCGAVPVQEVLVLSTCWRWVSLQALRAHFTQQGPTCFDITSDTIQMTLEIAPDQLRVFTPIFHPLVHGKEGSFGEHMNKLFDMIHENSNLTNQPVLLQVVLEEGKRWLTKLAPMHVQMVPANFRARLLAFQQGSKLDGGFSSHTTFVFTKYPKRLVPELMKLLVFLWRTDQNLFFAKESLTRLRSIASLIAQAALETIPNVRSHTTIVRYCVGRLLLKKDTADGGSLRVSSPGFIASTLSAILAILRASMCSIVYDMQGDYATQGMAMIQQAQESFTINFLGSTIRKMRELENLKPSSRKVSVTPDGNIAVDGFEFRMEYWSHVIPTTVNACMGIVGSLFEGDIGKRFVAMTVLSKSSSIQ